EPCPALLRIAKHCRSRLFTVRARRFSFTNQQTGKRAPNDCRSSRKDATSSRAEFSHTSKELICDSQGGKDRTRPRECWRNGMEINRGRPEAHRQRVSTAWQGPTARYAVNHTKCWSLWSPRPSGWRERVMIVATS